MFTNEATAAIVAPILVMPFMLFSGFYANFETMPAFIGWLVWTSPLHYSMEALAYSEFDHDD